MSYFEFLHQVMLKNKILPLGQEYWMGLEKIYQMTNARTFSLRVMMQTFEGITKTAFYSNFKLTENVRPESYF
jgi:hypothetical protein